jgi:predicted anti-sigma-YlaC factor YlaD
MLEADPSDLAGSGASALTAHLHSCEKCRRMADRILAAQEALDTSIASAQPRIPVNEALGAAARRAEHEHRRRTWRTAVPVAAAAGVAGLLLLSNRTGELPGQLWQPTPSTIGTGVDVEAPPDRSVVVFDIEDQPDVLVVWFFVKGDE